MAQQGLKQMALSSTMKSKSETLSFILHIPHVNRKSFFPPWSKRQYILILTISFTYRFSLTNTANKSCT